MSAALLRRLVLASALLVLLIVACSAYLRLAQSGLGCSEWPACYAAAGEASATPHSDGSHAWVRGAHRVSASLVSLLLVAVVLVGWEALGNTGSRVLAILVLALTGFLAWLGRMTPSSLPAVVLGNLAGGMLMAGLLFALWRRLAARPEAVIPAGAAGPAVLACTVLLVQIGLGGLVSARHAALACRSLADCTIAGAPDWLLFNPFADLAAQAGNPALGWLVLAHGLFSLVAVAAIILVAARALRFGHAMGGRNAALLCGRMLAGLLALQLLLGLCTAVLPSPLWPALLHNITAALLFSVLASLPAMSQAREAQARLQFA